MSKKEIRKLSQNRYFNFRRVRLRLSANVSVSHFGQNCCCLQSTHVYHPLCIFLSLCLSFTNSFFVFIYLPLSIFIRCLSQFMSFSLSLSLSLLKVYFLCLDPSFTFSLFITTLLFDTLKHLLSFHFPAFTLSA